MLVCKLTLDVSQLANKARIVVDKVTLSCFLVMYYLNVQMYIVI